MHMRDGRVLVLCGVLYTFQIHRDIISVLRLIKLRLSLSFHELCVQLTLGSILFGLGMISALFTILELDSSNNNFMLFSTHDYACYINDFHVVNKLSTNMKQIIGKKDELKKNLELKITA